MFHLDLNLMEESLDSFLLKAVPVNDDKRKEVDLPYCGNLFFLLAHL